MTNWDYPVGSRVRFWCDVYEKTLGPHMKPFWSYGTITMISDDKNWPYYIVWDLSNYNGLGTQTWWSFYSESKLELIQEPNDLLKELL